MHLHVAVGKSKNRPLVTFSGKVKQLEITDYEMPTNNLVSLYLAPNGFSHKSLAIVLAKIEKKNMKAEVIGLRYAYSIRRS